MVTNRLYDRLRTQGAQKRSPAMEAGSIDTVLCKPVDDRPGPATEAGKRELAAEIRLAMEFLPPEVRQLILWRDFEKLPHMEIGVRLGITAAAAHMRCSAAHDRLADALIKLRGGQFDDLPVESPE
jgi:DNA-directed RNA polymerase specialized sigma24 family protein